MLGWAGWSKLASIATAVAAIAALWFTAQSLKTTQHQIGLSEQGQLTERFSKAVELLGSDKINVRLGGVVALDGLADDSHKYRDTVRNLLSGYVRNQVPITTCGQLKERGVAKPLLDVQYALTVLLDRSIGGLNLSHTCLYGADLARAYLAGADLSGADLSGADLTDAKLMETKLVEANLTGADRTGANFAYADLSGAIGYP